jgi:hypothetical protein
MGRKMLLGIKERAERTKHSHGMAPPRSRYDQNTREEPCDSPL